MGKLGFNLMGSPQSPIVPVLVNSEKVATEFGEEMIENGIYVVGFSYPVVPKGMARIRVQLSAAHEKEHILKAVEVFEKIGRKKNLI
jgi:glycine C-acetyltransferase